ncbi:MAG: hypothetical protein AAGB14_14715, partial [Verrucomicrobiota bacterium]
MNSVSHRWTTHAGAIAAFVAAVFLGWRLGAPDDSLATSDKEVGAKEGPRQVLRSANQKRTTAEQRLNTIRETLSAEERLRKTIALAISMDPSDFPDWAKGGWFNFREGFELTMFRRIIEERWRNEDPDGFALWVLENGGRGPVWSADITTHSALPILTDIATTDSERLRGFFTNRPDESLETKVLDQLADRDPRLALDYLRDSSFLPSGNNHHFANIIDKIAASVPGELD